METVIQALEFKDGHFMPGKTHTSYITNLTTLLFHIQTPELWEEYCKDVPEGAKILKETLATVVHEWQALAREAGLAEKVTIDLKNLGNA